MMIGSEPLTDAQWDDDRTRRSADVHGRLSCRRLRPTHRRRADGVRRPGRAVPLRLAGRRSLRHRRRRAIGAAPNAVTDLFPVLDDVSFPFHWGGALAAPRDWHPHVAYDRAYRNRQRRWLRRRRSGDGEPRRAHARRPHRRSRHRSHPPAVGRAPITPLGTRAVALARCPARRPRPRRGPTTPSPVLRRSADPEPSAWGRLVDRFLGR